MFVQNEAGSELALNLWVINKVWWVFQTHHQSVNTLAHISIRVLFTIVYHISHQAFSFNILSKHFGSCKLIVWQIVLGHGVWITMTWKGSIKPVNILVCLVRIVFPSLYKFRAFHIAMDIVLLCVKVIFCCDSLGYSYEECRKSNKFHFSCSNFLTRILSPQAELSCSSVNKPFSMYLLYAWTISSGSSIGVGHQPALTSSANIKSRLCSYSFTKAEWV